MYSFVILWNVRNLYDVMNNTMWNKAAILSLSLSRYILFGRISSATHITHIYYIHCVWQKGAMQKAKPIKTLLSLSHIDFPSSYKINVHIICLSVMMIAPACTYSSIKSMFALPFYSLLLLFLLFLLILYLPNECCVCICRYDKSK